MRLFNTKKIEFIVKKLFNFSEASNLKRRANRYLKKNTEREIRILDKLIDKKKDLLISEFIEVFILIFLLNTLTLFMHLKQIHYYIQN